MCILRRVCSVLGDTWYNVEWLPRTAATKVAGSASSLSAAKKFIFGFEVFLKKKMVGLTASLAESPPPEAFRVSVSEPRPRSLVLHPVLVLLKNLFLVLRFFLKKKWSD
jgi:hypothetical protein